MRVAVAGLGSIGMRHSRNLKALGGQNICGFDPDEARRQRFADEIGGATYSDWSAALEAGADLAVIASPNSFHIEQSIAAAENDVALFIEKPLGSDITQARRLAKLVDDKKLFAHMGSNWKFHPAFKRMKLLLEQNAIGTPTAIQVIAGQWLPDWHPWEDYRQSYSAKKALGGGAVNDTHELDYMTWLLGPVEQLSGMTTNSGCLDIETDDVASCVMRFKNGALGSLLTDYIQRKRQRKYHISGDGGTIEWDLQNGLVVHYGILGESGGIYDESTFDFNAMYVDQIQWVLDAVMNCTPARTSIDDMIKIMQLQHGWHHGTLQPESR